jgi:hypothetical protein
MARPKKVHPDGREKKRATFVVFTDTKAKLDYMAFFEKKDLSDIVEEGLQLVIQKYEKKNGRIENVR